MKKLIVGLLAIGSLCYGEVLYGNNSNNAKVEKILTCLYKNIDVKKILKDEGLDNEEAIRNLLYAEKHKNEYFLKAIVLDYLYKGNNIGDYYKKAYKKSTGLQKIEAGMYYSIYLQKKGEFIEAYNLLREMEIFAGASQEVIKKIGYLYLLSGKQKELKAESYIEIKKIDLDLLGVEINVCSK